MTDDELWSQFHAYAIPQAAWDHRAHVRTACLFLLRHDLDAAHVLMRVGIIRQNERHGLTETPQRGYFETLTRVWLILVADALRRTNARCSEALLEAAPELLSRELPLRYYSKARLASTRARALFVDPDLAPLPEV